MASLDVHQTIGNHETQSRRETEISIRRSGHKSRYLRREDLEEGSQYRSYAISTGCRKGSQGNGKIKNLVPVHFYLLLFCPNFIEYFVWSIYCLSNGCVKNVKTLDDWSFDAFSLNDAAMGAPVKYLGYDLLNRYGMIHKFKVPPVVLESFLSRVEEGYCRHRNPYHNNLHAADVAQTMHWVLCQTGLMVSTVCWFRHFLDAHRSTTVRRIN